MSHEYLHLLHEHRPYDIRQCSGFVAMFSASGNHYAVAFNKYLRTFSKLDLETPIENLAEVTDLAPVRRHFRVILH